MGRGNFCPRGEISDQWYIDYDVYRWDDEEHEEYEIDFDLVADDETIIMEAIRSRFPSFYPSEKMVDGYWGQVQKLENKLFVVGTADNQWANCIYIQMREDLWPEQENLAARHFESYRQGIQKILLEQLGTIYLRSGPWTSSKLTLEEVPA